MAKILQSIQKRQNCTTVLAMLWRTVLSCTKEATTLWKWCLYNNVYPSATTCWQIIHLHINGGSATDFHYKDCCLQLQSNLENTCAHLAFVFRLWKVSAKSLRDPFSPSPVSPTPAATFLFYL